MSTAVILALICVPALILAAGLCKIAAREEERSERWLHVDDGGCEEANRDGQC